jgi:DNA polymerase
LETRSDCNLRKEGGRRYAAHPTTKILMAAALLDGRAIIWLPLLDAPPPFEVKWPEGFGPALPIEIHIGRALPSPLADAIRAGRSFAAHNAFGFEAFVWAAQGLPAPVAWIDTLPWARAAGCPGGLDAAACWLLGLNKDNAGAKLLKRYTQPFGEDRKFRAIPPDDLAALVRYNLIDTLLLTRLHPLLAHHDREPDLVRLDRVINTRGVQVDRTLARAALALEADESARLAREAEQATGGAVKPTDLTRVPYLSSWLESRGIPMSRTKKDHPSLTKEVADDLLRREDLPDDARAVLLARRAIGRVTTAKLGKALAFGDKDGRLRDQFLYHTAHTGRWTGHQAQLQNLPKPHEKLEDLTTLIESVHDAAAFRAALPEEVPFSDGLSALVRPSFIAAPGKILLIADFAGIEARGVAWLANEETQLNAFRQGRDLYCELATTVFGRPVSKKDTRERAVGKQAILGCQYSLGADRFDSTCKRNGVDLAAAGVTAEQVVDAHRDAYPKIAGYRRADGFGRTGGIWKAFEFAALATVQSGQSRQVSYCLFARDKDALVVTLPSGRRSYFRNARIEKRVPGYGGNAKPTLVFDSPGRDDRDSKKKGSKQGKGGHGWEDPTYGGKLTENITSGMCRDLLALTMLRCEQAGLPVVLHAHDEVVIEVPIAGAEDALRRLLVIMSEVPAWAEGFPIEVEGYTSFRYVKSPLPGALTIKARDGVVIKEVRIPGTPPLPPSFPPPSPLPGTVEKGDGKNTTPLPPKPAGAIDQIHNSVAPVPPRPSSSSSPPPLPPATVTLPPAALDVLGGRTNWACVQGDCLDVLASWPLDSTAMVFGSPPYVGARLYLEDGRDLGIARDTDAWVKWMVQVYRACLRASFYSAAHRAATSTSRSDGRNAIDSISPKGENAPVARSNDPRGSPSQTKLQRVLASAISGTEYAILLKCWSSGTFPTSRRPAQSSSQLQFRPWKGTTVSPEVLRGMKNTLFVLCWAFILFVAGYDVYFAWYYRAFFRDWELNPLARWIAQDYGLIAVFVVKMILLGFIVAVASYCHFRRHYLDLPYTLVVSGIHFLLSIHYVVMQVVPI